MASRSAAGVSDATLTRAGIATPKKSARSNAAKGTHYKNRTKEWLEKQGYAVARMEHLAWIRTGSNVCATCERPEMIPTKRDEFGSDLLAIRADGEIVFVQVKLGADQVAAARRLFASFPFPPCAKRWIAVWTVGAHAPDVVDCSADTVASLGPVRRRKTAGEGKLF